MAAVLTLHNATSAGTHAGRAARQASWWLFLIRVSWCLLELDYHRSDLVLKDRGGDQLHAGCRVGQLVRDRVRDSASLLDLARL